MNQACHHPGTYLQELLIWHQISAEDLAREINLPSRAIVELTSALRPVNYELSCGLAGYFGNSAHFWLELQARFDRETSV